MWRPTAQIVAVLLISCKYAASSTNATLPEPPKPYQFGYTVKDETSGDFKTHEEVSDGEGVRGMYSVAEPNGDLRVVTYTADRANGFKALVKVHPSGSPVYHPTSSYDEIKQRSPHYSIVPSTSSQHHNTNYQNTNRQQYSTLLLHTIGNKYFNKSELIPKNLSKESIGKNNNSSQIITSTDKILLENINSTKQSNNEADKKETDNIKDIGHTVLEGARSIPVSIQKDPTNNEPEMVESHMAGSIAINKKPEVENNGNVFKYMKDHDNIKELTSDPSFPNIEIPDVNYRGKINSVNVTTVTENLKKGQTEERSTLIGEDLKINTQTTQTKTALKEKLNVRILPQSNLNKNVSSSSRKVVKDSLSSDTVIFRLAPNTPLKIEKQTLQNQLKKLDGEDVIHIKSDRAQMALGEIKNDTKQYILSQNTTDEIRKGLHLKSNPNSSIMLAALLLPTTPLIKMSCSPEAPGKVSPIVPPTTSGNIAVTNTPLLITQEPLRLIFTTGIPFYPYHLLNLNTYKEANVDQDGKLIHTSTAQSSTDGTTSVSTDYDILPTTIPHLIPQSPPSAVPKPPNGYTSFRNEGPYTYNNRKTVQNIHYPHFLPPPWSHHPLRPAHNSHYRQMPIFVLPMSHNFNFAPTFDPGMHEKHN